MNPLPNDGEIIFTEEGHEYTVYGEKIDRSCTGVVGSYFAPFDPVANTNKFYAGWQREYDRGNTAHKYYAIIHDTLERGGDHDDAAAAIRASWEAEGAKAARLGTLLHLHCEYDLNADALAPDAEIWNEIEQFNEFKASTWVQDLGLRPYRTELCVGWRVGGQSVSAGQIDALYIDEAGLYYIIDFKRVKHTTILDPDKAATRQGFKGARALPPISHVPDTHYQHYSLQTSIYNLMLRNTTAIDVEDRMFLVRMHVDRLHVEIVKCHDLRTEAKVLLEAEHARLTTTATG